MSRYPTYGSSGPPPSGYEYSQQQQPQYGDDPARSRPGFPPSSVPGPPAGGPNFRWWIPENGIRRDVIQADIQRYLGPDALVKPGEGRDEDRVGLSTRSYILVVGSNLKAGTSRLLDSGIPHFDKGILLLTIAMS